MCFENMLFFSFLSDWYWSKFAAHWPAFRCNCPMKVSREGMHALQMCEVEFWTRTSQGNLLTLFVASALSLTGSAGAASQCTHLCCKVWRPT